MAVADILNPVRELGYLVKREFLLLAGKGGAHPIAEVAAPVVSKMPLAGSLAASNTLVGVLTLGAVGAVSAALTQMDYNHKKNNLKELYKDELAAKLGKPKDKVTVSDLELLAKQNGTLGAELKRSKKQRNFGVVVSFLASMAAVGAVGMIPAIAAGAAVTAVIHMVVGVAAYHIIKDPIHKVADKLFNIDEKTTNDHIVAIERDREAGKVISREQVLSAFVQANPEIDRLIVANYGKHFDDLAVADKQRAAQDLNQMIPLDKMTLDINSGRINVMELAFAVEGQQSGFTRDGSEAEDKKRGLRGALKKAGEKIEDSKAGHVATAMLTPDQVVTPVRAELETPIEKMTHKLGLTKSDQGKSHVERLEQSRSGNQTLGIQ
jgi:hypothetical protein